MSQPATSNIVQMARLRRLAKEQAQSQPKPKILFVDDEERILNSLKALFRLQYEVDVSIDGHHALELMKRKHYHLLVSDQRMPTMQGVELLRRAREISPNTMRILLTGFSDLAAIVGSVNDGEVYRYINKPWNSEELNKVIGDAVKIGLELEKLQPVAEKTDDEQAADQYQEGQHSGAEVKPFLGQGRTAIEDADDTAFASNVVPIREDVLPNGTILFIDQEGQLRSTFQNATIKGCSALSANTADEALQLMEQHEVGVIVASIDGADRGNIGFLCLLKKEHPHVIALAVARLGDSETIIGLVNSARIFRVIFHPLRPNVLRHHLIAALKQMKSFQARPELLKVQKAKEVEPASNLMTGIGSLLKTRMRSIRSFFKKQ